mmetsp:Transcript_36380/g.47747  ORF Transcript_36380/g.47747 Transcript_36380/m.47747 type:complete len:88 (-) Transcript_36380:1820-2083(-)
MHFLIDRKCKDVNTRVEDFENRLKKALTGDPVMRFMDLLVYTDDLQQQRAHSSELRDECNDISELEGASKEKNMQRAIQRFNNAHDF